MADVYEAYDRTLGRPVALKLLRAGLSADRVFVDRFTREARSAASFGIARTAEAADLTQTAALLGSVQYLWPEVTSAGTRHFSGTWYLIRNGNSWLMDSPSLGPA